MEHALSTVCPRAPGYNDRTPFWPLEFRGILRKQVLAYAQEERNFFLYKTWLNSDSAYEWMTRLLK